MASVDVERAASVPLSTSPILNGHASNGLALDEVSLHTDTVQDSNINGKLEVLPIESPLPLAPVKDIDLNASDDVPEVTPGATPAPSDDTPAPSDIPAPTPIDQKPEYIEGQTVTMEPPPPPTPPAKSTNFPNPMTPPPRRESLLPSPGRLANGNARPSTDSVNSRRGNGLRIGAQTPPTRSASPAASHRRSLTISKGRTVSVVLISSALETIAASREAKRSVPLRESVQRALDMVKSGQGGDRPRDIFEPLRLACETRNEKLMIASLDCISKLISYSFFIEATSPQGLPSPPPSPGPNGAPSHVEPSQIPLVDLVVQTITGCHNESTPDTVSLQIVKALLSLVLSPTVLVHQSSLLKAVRTVYNVFLLSTDPVNQTVAQGGLTQMVNHVFTRCKIIPPPLSRSDSNATLASARGDATSPSTRLSLASASRQNLPMSPSPTQASTSHGDESTVAPSETSESSQTESIPNASRESITEITIRTSTETTVADNHRPPPSETAGSEALPEDDHENGILREMSTNDLFIKDAFLVFRALCKLTMKPLNQESERDLKSHAMRSKLLSLHLVLTILNNHMPIFVSPSAIIYSSSSHEATTFVQAVNQYLCLCLSRNAVSPVPQVFEICVEIFWRVLSGMRTKLKKEIEVLLHEIFIPILEMKTSTLKQKAAILGMLQRLSKDPQALVEIYLNYDCDSDAIDNIYEHLMNIVSKLVSSPMTQNPKKENDPTSPGLPPQSKGYQNTVPPTLSTSALAVPGNMDIASMGLSETQLKRQALECLVSVLKSLVVWGTATTATSDPSGESHARSQAAEESQVEAVTPDPSLDRLTGFPNGFDTSRQPTPEITDDPSRFESAKQRKTTLLEGIKKFNFKPKRGIEFLIETGFIASATPQDVARFLSKRMVSARL
ncbi:hypothetical protein QCA50_000656 [Cerrena zonata]|uniref:SEC7 domain-containing protein n=1 Tax=Cerrena zonata TaxID=2478898 RepID=A0AAW0H0A1_9APHY